MTDDYVRIMAVFEDHRPNEFELTELLEALTPVLKLLIGNKVLRFFHKLKNELK